VTGPGQSTDDPVRRAKQDLRRQILSARAALSAGERGELSAVIATRVLELPEVERARCVLAYLSFGQEIETDDLLSTLRERDVKVVLPRIDRAAHQLRLYQVVDFDSDTEPGVWGIREPSPARCRLAELSELDLIIVPGVAFTPSGDRLGYGGGYYDGLLARSTQPPTLVAPAFDLQIVGSLPVTSHDVPVDIIVTQSAVHRRR
jgi:5-formyltetrahydrofolate cyclo-ligase